MDKRNPFYPVDAMLKAQADAYRAAARDCVGDATANAIFLGLWTSVEAARMAYEQAIDEHIDALKATSGDEPAAPLRQTGGSNE